MTRGEGCQRSSLVTEMRTTAALGIFPLFFFLKDNYSTLKPFSFKKERKRREGKKAGSEGALLVLCVYV